MSWSWRIGRIAGIDVYVHFTFLLLLAWVGVEYYLAHGSLAEALYGVAFILALFGIVVLHELGHALAARGYGIRTRDITLLPIGGVARLERMPEEPRQELVVALAGPAVNVVMAVGIYIGMALGQGLAPLGDVLSVEGNFVSQLFWVNVSLALFNLLPAFPMDGGRVLRALLAFRLDYVRATQVAARVGQGMALLFGFVGLFFNPFLVFIALFLQTALARLQHCDCHTLPVVQGNRLLGLVTADNLAEVLMVQEALGEARRSAAGRTEPVARVGIDAH
jgi:Zn-dependent protease